MRAAAGLRQLLVATVVAWTGAVLPPGQAVASPEADARQGIDAFAAGQLQEAVDAFSRAIDSGALVGADLVTVLNDRGVAYERLGAYELAIADYESALAFEPEDPVTRANLALALLHRGDAAQVLGEPRQARSDYDRLIALDPAAALGWERRGRLRLAEGDRAGARGDLEIAARRDPALAPALRRLAAGQPPTPATSSEAVVAAASPPVAAAPPAALPASVAANNAAPLVPAAVDPGAATLASPPVPSAVVTAAAEPAPVAATPPSAPVAPLAEGPPLPPVTIAKPKGSAPRGERRVLVDEANIRAGPGGSFARLTALGKGSAVEVVGREGNWFVLRLGDGRRGYVYRKLVGGAAG